MQRISYLILSGAMAFGLAAAVPASAGPAQLGVSAVEAPNAPAQQDARVLQVQNHWSCAGNYCVNQNGTERSRGQLGKGGGWSGGNGWNNNWKPKHPKRWNHYRQPGIYLDLYVPGTRYIQRAPARRGNLVSLHVEWCYDHYPRSYRPSDNTWKPKKGSRRECYSPYL